MNGRERKKATGKKMVERARCRGVDGRNEVSGSRSDGRCFGFTLGSRVMRTHFTPYMLSTHVHGRTQAEQPQSFCDTLYMQTAAIAPSLPASTRQRRAAARAQATYARNLDVPGPLCRPSAAHGKRACHRDALFRGYRFERLAARALHWSGAVGAFAHRGLRAGARATRAPSPSPTQ